MSEESKQPASPTKPRKKRLWFWVKSLLLLSLCSLWLVNGLGTRYAAKNFLHNLLVRQGMQGSFDIEGTLFGGLTLHNVRYEGTESLTRLHAKKITLRYSLMRALREWKVDQAIVEDAIIGVNIDYSSPPSDRPRTPAWTTVNDIHPYLMAQEMLLKRGEVFLTRGTEAYAQFFFHKLEHHADTEVFQFHEFIGQRNEAKTTPQNVQLKWQIGRFQLDDWEILPELRLRQVQLAWNPTDITELIGEMDFAQSSFSWDYRLEDRLLLSQKPDTSWSDRDLERVAGVVLPFHFEMTALQADFQNVSEAFTDWQGTGTAKVNQVWWRDYHGEQLELKFNQQDRKLDAQLTGNSLGIPARLDANCQWHAVLAKSKDWWDGAKIQAKASLGKLKPYLDATESSFQLSPLQVNAPELHAQASFILESNSIRELTSQLQAPRGAVWRNHIVPAFSARGDSLDLTQWHYEILSNDKQLHAKSDMNFDRMEYAGELILKQLDSEWLNPILNEFLPDYTFQEKIDFQWKGQGPLNQSTGHQGNVNCENLQLTSTSLGTWKISQNTHYQWPNKIQVAECFLSQDLWTFDLKGSWAEEQLVLDRLQLHRQDRAVLTGNGNFPFPQNIRSFHDFMDQQAPIDLQLELAETQSDECRELLPHLLPESIQGSVAAKLHITGNIHDPKLLAEVQAKNILGIDDKELGAIDATLSLKNTKNHLELTGAIKELNQDRVDLFAKIPMDLKTWSNDPELFLDSQFEAIAKVRELPLQRLKNFIPDLEKNVRRYEGDFSGNITAKGTLRNPTLKAEASAKIPLIEFTSRQLPSIQNAQLEASLENHIITIKRFETRAAGGRFTLDGKIPLENLLDPKPSFDLRLKADHALIHRDEKVLVRANADLQFRGPWRTATLSGNLDVVESLFFKDIELLPIGVPSSTVSKVELPALDTPGGGRMPVPSMLDQWKLDLNLRLKDPFLIRGNIAKGEVTGSAKIGGTFAFPQPLGKLELKDIVARLPFSQLRVPYGELVFDGKSGLDPKLEVRGTSQIGIYSVNLFLVGSASSPKIVLTSNPPLPENEILTLLATGTNSAGLENPQVASVKAFQFFIQQVKVRAERPGGNKLFAALLSTLDTVNINVGEGDAFTNRRFNSAQIKFSDRWNFTAQIDQNGNSRGLLVFSIRLY